jgi:hypothetical protein
MLKLKSNQIFWFFNLEKSTGFVQLIDVPRLALRKGDTIVTGGQSEIFRKHHWNN